MVYFKFLSEITDVGLRISFKGVKDFSHRRPKVVKASFKILKRKNRYVFERPSWPDAKIGPSETQNSTGENY